MTATYDEKCYDLAAAFLEDEPHLLTHLNNVALAQVIQNAVESWIDFTKLNYEPEDQP